MYSQVRIHEWLWAVRASAESTNTDGPQESINEIYSQKVWWPDQLSRDSPCIDRAKSSDLEVGCNRFLEMFGNVPSETELCKTGCSDNDIPSPSPIA